MPKTEGSLSGNCSLSLFYLEVVGLEAVFCIWRGTKIYFNKNIPNNKQSKNPDSSEALIFICSSLDTETVSLNKMIHFE